MGSKEALLSLASPVVPCDIAEVSGLYVRVMNGKERDAFEGSVLNSDGKVVHENMRAKLLVRCLCDETGKRLFNELEIESLGAVRADVLDKLFAKAQAVNGIGKSDLDELKKN